MTTKTPPNTQKKDAQWPDRMARSIYANDFQYENPKEYFKSCLALARKAGFSAGDVYDFGCAGGAFCYYLQKQLPTSRVFGVDVLPELTKKASLSVPKASFITGSVQERRLRNRY